MTVRATRQSVEDAQDVTHQSAPGCHSRYQELAPGSASEQKGPLALAPITLGAERPSSATADLVEHHLHLVGILVTERLRDVPTYVLRDDLVSAGMMALVLSARAYEPGRGVPFRNFAALRIRGALIDELRAMDWASRSVRSRAREVATVCDDLAKSLDRAPDSGDIAAAMGVSARELDALNADLARGSVLSLQLLTRDTPGNSADCPESLILRREQIGYLHDAIAALPRR